MPAHGERCEGARRVNRHGAIGHRGMDLNLPHVSVTTVLVVGQHGDLDHERIDTRTVFQVLERNL